MNFQLDSETDANGEFSVIILVGGSARRFQANKRNSRWVDKVLAIYRGNPLLSWVVKNISSTSAIIVVTDNESRREKYRKILSNFTNLKDYRIQFLLDNPTVASQGPLRGLISGLTASNSRVTVSLPCDLPYFTWTEISVLVNKIGESDFSVPVWSDGRIEPLVIAYKTSETLVPRLLFSKIKTKRPTDLIRGLRRGNFIHVLDVVSESGNLTKTFAHINTQEDLTRLEGYPSQQNDVSNTNTRTITIYPITAVKTLSRVLEDIFRSSGQLNTILRSTADTLARSQTYFWSAFFWRYLASLSTELKREKSFREASKEFEREASLWKANEIPFLELHALLDSLEVDRALRNIISDYGEELNLLVSQKEKRIADLKTKMGIEPKNHLREQNDFCLG